MSKESKDTNLCCPKCYGEVEPDRGNYRCIKCGVWCSYDAARMGKIRCDCGLRDFTLPTDKTDYEE